VLNGDAGTNAKEKIFRFIPPRSINSAGDIFFASSSKNNHGEEGTHGSSLGNSSRFQDSFSKSFRECLLSFNFDFIGLLAGFALASRLDLFRFAPWVISIYPAILSAKGMIAGMLTGRLSTALHVGTVYPRFLKNTKTFYKLFDAIIVIALITSIFMSLIAVIFGFFFWGMEVGSLLEVISNVTATMALGMSIATLTAYVSFLSFKRGLDPDVVVYPVMSSTADVIITAYYILVVSVFFTLSNLGKTIIVAISITYFALTIVTVIRNLSDKEFLRNIREVILTLIVVAFIVNVTGTFLSKISAIIEEKRELYMVYPAFIDMIGDVGSVVGSVSTTRLALGLINPAFKSIMMVKKYIFSSWLASIIVFTFLSFVSLVLSGALSPFYFFIFTLILTTANIIAVPVIVLVSYSVSILTFKRGWDPDNFVIPVESSLADGVATITLFLTLFIYQI